MSLRNFLSLPDVKQRLKAEVSLPKIDTGRALLAPPLTQNPQLVGTAFDYLLRLYIKRLNPKAKTYPWTAEAVARLWPVIDNRPSLELVKTIREFSEVYLEDGKITDLLLKGMLCLAKLDPIYRAGLWDDPDLGSYERVDRKDLRELLSLVTDDLFKARKFCALNPRFCPTFEIKKIGGADADLLMDDALIEIKTVKRLELSRDTLYQLLGYYALSLICGIQGTPKGHRVRKLGVYFSRHGYLWLTEVQAVLTEEKVASFTAWFRNRINGAK